MDIEDFSVNREPRARALIPFAVFLVFYLGLSIVSGDFYKVPMPVAFLVASATSLFLSHKASLRSKIELFAHGMGNVDIMVMCLIFILAGAFAGTAKAMGAVDATVHLAMAILPSDLLAAVGTIVALAPIAVGLTANLDLSAGLCLGAVVGGAMFGDNLSMISDTTIAATRTQGVEMREKFRANFRIALPAAAAALIVFFLLSPGGAAPAPAAIHFSTVLRVLPYLSVLILALFGVNVMALLAFGTLFAGIVGLGCGSFDFWQFLDAAGKGALSMSETLIVAAECDVLYDQGKAFAELLKKNGVPVTHRTLPGTIHAFMTYPGMENAYQEGVRLATEFLTGKEIQMKNHITPESIVRISRIEVDPAQLPEYLALVTECGRESMAKEAGVYMMYSMQEKAHPERISILEIYADRAAYEHHIQTPHFQKYKKRTLKMVKQLDLLDQNPLVPEMKMK